MKKYGILLGLAMTAFAVFAHPSVAEAADSTQERILDGIQIGNIDVGGMTEDEARSAVQEYVDGIMDTEFTLSSTKGTMEITAEDMGLTADADTPIEDALNIGKKGSLIERFKEEKAIEKGEYVLGLNLRIDRQKTANLIYENRESLDIPAEDNGLVRENGAFSYVKGQRGEEVNIVSSVYEIEKFLSDGWDGKKGEIALVVEEIEPRGTEEELAKVKDVLGTFSTSFSSSSSGRAVNVTNGCAKIDGTVLYPGEEFSVYRAASPFTQDNGYELASAYANGAVVESFGGGVCQVSTTLYNAVIRAELEVTKRYNHSMTVSYVDPSEDAAIAGTYKDFCFVNNFDTPIYIEGYCSGGVITFNIYGEETRPSNREISFESEVLEKIEPETKIELNSGHDLGYFSTVQSSHTGYVSRLWKTVTVDGEQQSREVFNKSTYRASPKIISVGTKGATEEQLAAIKSAASSKGESKVRDAVSKAKSENEKAEDDKDKDDKDKDDKDKDDKDKDDKDKSDKDKSDKDTDKGSDKKDTDKKDTDKKSSKTDDSSSTSSKKEKADESDDSGTEDQKTDGSSSDSKEDSGE